MRVTEQSKEKKKTCKDCIWFDKEKCSDDIVCEHYTPNDNELLDAEIKRERKIFTNEYLRYCYEEKE